MQKLRKAWVAILISNNIDLKTRDMIKNKEKLHNNKGRPLIPEDVIILRLYVPNNRAWKYTKTKLIDLKGGIDKSTVVIVHFNTLEECW